MHNMKEGWNLLIISILEILKFSDLYFFGIYLNFDTGDVQHGSHNPFKYYHTEKKGEKTILKIITLKRKWVVWSPCIDWPFNNEVASAFSFSWSKDPWEEISVFVFTVEPILVMNHDHTTMILSTNLSKTYIHKGKKHGLKKPEFFLRRSPNKHFEEERLQFNYFNCLSLSHSLSSFLLILIKVFKLTTYIIYCLPFHGLPCTHKSLQNESLAFITHD